MTRNKALRGAAWLTTLLIANVTTIGAMLQNTFAELELGFLAQAANPQVPLNELTVRLAQITHPEVTTHAWWVTFAVLTLFAWYMGKVFVGIWGREPATPIAVSHEPLQAIGRA